MEKIFMYHVTNKNNLPSIYKHGILRGGLGRKKEFVYLSEEYDSWFNYSKACELAILRIDVTGLEEKMTVAVRNENEPQLDEILVWDDISSERIHSVIEIKLYTE